MSDAVKPRGRPRSETARKAILEAARALLAEGGPGAVTMEAVAARAGVGRPTVYRWWPDRHAVAMAALMDESTPDAAQGAALNALRQQLHAIAQKFGTPTGRHITTLLTSADPSSELSKAFRNHFVLARRAEGRGLLETAQKAGELRENADLEVALDALYGAIFFRLLLGHAPLTEKFINQTLDQLLVGMK